MTPAAARDLRPPRFSAFVLAVLAWLPLTFAVWYFGAPLLLWPAVLIIEAIAHGAFGALVTAVEQAGALVSFTTSLRPGTGLPGGFVSVDVNLLLYSFGMPMLAALVLAARETAWKRHLVVGYLVLAPFIAWGGLADFLKNVAITAGPQVASQTGFSSAQREAIAFAFQFGSLILPAIVPAIVWVLMHRRFLERLRGTTSA
ncbi:MAG TPA: exosortase H-associated membrane protein [Casimicrobiaceae bacterium]|nr:exosortase H-associated membrane protein [Casimicrobiaceae bacterium]